MKRFRFLAVLLVGIMVTVVPCAALAAVRDDAVSPFYLYTRKVQASLEISESGQATCYGYVKASTPGSDISITLTLYKKSGALWEKAASWSASAASLVLEINKNRQVSVGTYKVVLSGSVTSPEGETEAINAASAQITYSKG